MPGDVAVIERGSSGNVVPTRRFAPDAGAFSGNSRGLVTAASISKRNQGAGDQ